MLRFPNGYVADETYGIIPSVGASAVWGMNDRAVDKRGPTLTAAGGTDRKPGKTRSDDVPRGIVCMVIATILFAGASAASKWLVGIYPVGEVLCLRSFASLLLGL